MDQRGSAYRSRAAAAGALIAAVVALAPLGAGAERVVLRYDATWGGVPAGEISLTLDEAAEQFRYATEMRASGMARLLTGFRAHAESAGIAAPGAPIPERYDATYDLRRRLDKRIGVRYLRTSTATIAVSSVPKLAAKSRLPEAERRDVVDPLSALWMVRDLARRGALRPGEPLTVRVFDGKRRFDVEAAWLGEVSLRVGAETILATRLKLALRPVATIKVERDDEEDDARLVELWLSADGRALPLRLSVDLAYVPLVIVARDECLSGCRVAQQ